MKMTRVKSKMTSMTIGKKLILGFIGLALLVGVVGYYGLNASKQITKSFEDGEDNGKENPCG